MNICAGQTDGQTLGATLRLTGDVSQYLWPLWTATFPTSKREDVCYGRPSSLTDVWTQSHPWVHLRMALWGDMAVTPPSTPRPLE